jgi:CubicO group peptidase (beta-lactamase class C family)
MAELARVPLLYQPGEAWLYDTCSTLQGVLIARVAGQPLPSFLAERVFEPLRMVDTGFEVPSAKRGRFTSYYRTSQAGALELADGPGGQWSTPPALGLGNGGLAGTVDDWTWPLRLGRRDRNVGPHQPSYRHGSHPAHPGSGRQLRPAQVDAGLLSLRLQRPLSSSSAHLFPVTGTNRARHALPLVGTRGP